MNKHKQNGSLDQEALLEVKAKKISDFDTVALSFLFDKYCPIMN